MQEVFPTANWWRQADSPTHLSAVSQAYTSRMSAHWIWLNMLWEASTLGRVSYDVIVRDVTLVQYAVSFSWMRTSLPWTRSQHTRTSESFSPDSNQQVLTVVWTHAALPNMLFRILYNLLLTWCFTLLHHCLRMQVLEITAACRLSVCCYYRGNNVSWYLKWFDHYAWCGSTCYVQVTTLWNCNVTSYSIVHVATQVTCRWQHCETVMLRVTALCMLQHMLHAGDNTVKL